MEVGTGDERRASNLRKATSDQRPGVGTIRRITPYKRGHGRRRALFHFRWTSATPRTQRRPRRQRRHLPQVAFEGAGRLRLPGQQTRVLLQEDRPCRVQLPPHLGEELHIRRHGGLNCIQPPGRPGQGLAVHPQKESVDRKELGGQPGLNLLAKRDPHDVPLQVRIPQSNSSSTDSIISSTTR